MKKNYFNLDKYKNKINCGFFTIKGGVSKGEYYSLNCGIGGKDKKKNVKKNIQIAIQNLGLQKKKIKINQSNTLK